MSAPGPIPLILSYRGVLNHPSQETYIKNNIQPLFIGPVEGTTVKCVPTPASVTWFLPIFLSLSLILPAPYTARRIFMPRVIAKKILDCKCIQINIYVNTYICANHDTLATGPMFRQVPMDT